MKALILAAGYATRLYPLTQNKPKCLLPVGPSTILDILVQKLDKLAAVSEILIVTNAKFYPQLMEWRQKTKARLPITILDDGTTSNDTRLGAIGDFQLAVRSQKIADDVLLLASDNLFDQNLADFIDFARKKSPGISVATFDLGDPAQAAGKFGVFELAPDGQVTGMEEKPAKPKTAIIGVGVYYFPKSSLGFLDAYLKHPGAQDAPGFFIRWLRDNGADIFAFKFKGLWYDIGDLKSLEEAGSIFTKK